MAALNANKRAAERSHHLVTDPVAATEVIYKGALVFLDASGNAEPASTATGKTSRGVANEYVDNQAGAAGDKTVQSRVGVFLFENDGTTPVDRTHIGSDCYAVDDQTVSADGTGRSVAGKVVDIDPDGRVFVKVGV